MYHGNSDARDDYSPGRGRAWAKRAWARRVRRALANLDARDEG